jgi:Prokaryotic E2 family D
MLEGSAEPTLGVVFSPQNPEEVKTAIRMVSRFVALNVALFEMVEEMQSWEKRHGGTHLDRENHRFELREALLVYGDRQRSFVTRHQVTPHKDLPPTLEPAQPLTLGFLESLVRSLSGPSTAEVFPENVLAKGNRMIAWWTQACRRQMFYENSEQKAAKLNGRTFP